VEYRVRQAGKFRGRWAAGGDKSLTHRAFIFNAMAEGEARVENASSGDDCRRTRLMLERLGVEFEGEGRKGWRIQGSSSRFRAVDSALDAGNSGTTLRLMAGLLASCPGIHRLDGDSSLRKRPMERIKHPLEALGARVGLSEGGVPPLTVEGGPLTACDYESPVASAQVKSAFLLAAMKASGASSYREPCLSRDHSERMLGSMGIEMTRDQDGLLRLSGPQTPRARDFIVPGDISSAAFPLAAALLIEGSNFIVKKVGVNPTRTGWLRAVARMGGKIASYHPAEALGEPVADLLARHSELRGLQLADEEIPSLIDEIPVLAVLASQAVGPSEFHGLAELRHKESDRLEACRRMLEAFGAKASVLGDSLLVEGKSRLRACEFDPEGDHRMAMAATIMALVAKGESRILGADCVETSFPEFPFLIRRMSQGALEIAGKET